MCLPPELSLEDAGAVEEQYVNDVVQPLPDFFTSSRLLSHNAFPHAAVPSFLGKRPLECSRFAQPWSSPKVPKLVSPGASEAAAASLMARLEMSMLSSSQTWPQQLKQRQSLTPASVLLDEEVKMQEQLQDLQRALLLKQSHKTPSVAEQQQLLLLAHQRLLQQSRNLMPATQLPTTAAVAVPPEQAEADALFASSRIRLSSTPAAAAVPASLFSSSSSLYPGSASLAHSLSPGASHHPMLGAASPFHFQASPLDEEKKHKRMESNRASAKRSRQRKQERMEELDKATAVLQEENNVLCQKLEEANNVIQGLKEKNGTLEEELGVLRRMLHGDESNKLNGGSLMVAHSVACNRSTAECGSEVLPALPYPCDGLDEIAREGPSDGEASTLLPECAGLEADLTGDVFSELLACFES